MTIQAISAVAKSEMMIRKPVSTVFNAFIDPLVTCKFWFTKGSGLLKEGVEVTWTWENYNVSIPVTVKKIIPEKLIEIEWGNRDETTNVIWSFRKLSDDSTFVSIVNSGFTGDNEKILAQVRDSTEGFALVLAGLKAYLEHGIQLNLVADRFPEGL